MNSLPRAATRSLLLAASCLSFALLASVASAQAKPARSRQLAEKEGPAPTRNSVIPEEFRDLSPEELRDLAINPPRSSADDSLRTYSIAEPLRSPKGEVLAAVVGERTMTLAELNQRVAAVIKSESPLYHPDPARRSELEEQKRREIAEKILQDWSETAALAQEAIRRGSKVTDQEVQESLAKLAQASKGEGPKEPPSALSVGIPESQLRDETRDALLIEKFVTAVVNATYNDDFYRKLFKDNPAAFLIPPRVRAFHVFRFLDRSMTDRQKNEVRNQMKDLRKQLKKKNPDYKSLQAKSDPNAKLTIGDLGWISADTPLPAGMLNMLFRLSPGETSDIFEDATGAHIVRILERQEGSRFTFEDAKPQIVNYTFAKTKQAVYATIAPQYAIATGVDGLAQRREVTKEEYDEYVETRRRAMATQREPRVSPIRSAPQKPPAPKPAAPAPEKPAAIPPKPASTKGAPAVDLSILPPPPVENKETPTGDPVSKRPPAR